MDRTTIESTMFPDCPIRNILARISDKWSLLVIYTLDRAEKEKMRFKELQRKIPDITRTVYPEVPPRVEYTLTPRAHSLIPHINGLIEWALENRDAILNDRKQTVRKTHSESVC